MGMGEYHIKTLFLVLKFSNRVPLWEPWRSVSLENIGNDFFSNISYNISGDGFNRTASFWSHNETWGHNVKAWFHKSSLRYCDSMARNMCGLAWSIYEIQNTERDGMMVWALCILEKLNEHMVELTSLFWKLRSIDKEHSDDSCYWAHNRMGNYDRLQDCYRSQEGKP